MIKPRCLALAILLAATTGGYAAARDLGGSKDNLQAFCSGDYIRLCSGIDPNGPAVEACFRKNMKDVSPGCQAAIAEYKSAKPKNSRVQN